MSRGSVVINNAAGRSLRKKAAPVLAGEVLSCAGGFSAGDTVYIAFRGADGGQYVIGSGIVCCDESALLQMLGKPDAATLLIREQDVQLLW